MVGTGRLGNRSSRPAQANQHLWPVARRQRPWLTSSSRCVFQFYLRMTTLVEATSWNFGPVSTLKTSTNALSRPAQIGFNQSDWPELLTSRQCELRTPEGYMGPIMVCKPCRSHDMHRHCSYGLPWSLDGNVREVMKGRRGSREAERIPKKEMRKERETVLSCAPAPTNSDNRNT